MLCRKCKLKNACYALLSDLKNKYCYGCKSSDMVDIVHKKCVVCKITRPTFGLKGQKATHCDKCSPPGMVDVNHKLCITCDNNSFQIVNNIFFTKSGHVIPQWFKKIGNYSLLPPPINRNDALNPFKTELQEYHQPDADININIDIKKIIPGMKDYKAR